MLLLGRIRYSSSSLVDHETQGTKMGKHDRVLVRKKGDVTNAMSVDAEMNLEKRCNAASKELFFVLSLAIIVIAEGPYVYINQTGRALSF